MIFVHAGGTMPSVNERLVLLAKTPRYQQALPNAFLAEAAKFYYDTATTSNAAAMSAIRKLVPPSHMIFGTDFPFRGIADQAQALNVRRLHRAGARCDQPRQRGRKCCRAFRAEVRLGNHLSRCPPLFVCASRSMSTASERVRNPEELPAWVDGCAP
jgi:hypothetical protein